jgi:hypothetical protein
MFGQVKDAAIARDLQVERQAWLEAVTPVDLESQEIHIEFLGFRFIEDAEDGSGAMNFHASALCDLIDCITIQFP